MQLDVDNFIVISSACIACMYVIYISIKSFKSTIYQELIQENRSRLIFIGQIGNNNKKLQLD